jgi:hypothetical protein
VIAPHLVQPPLVEWKHGPALERVGPLCSESVRFLEKEHPMADLDPTEITEQMRTFHAEDVAAQEAWKLHSPMWRMISARFYNLHHIDLRRHVKAIIEVKPTINAGFDCVPVDGDARARLPRELRAEPALRRREG